MTDPNTPAESVETAGKKALTSEQIRVRMVCVFLVLGIFAVFWQLKDCDYINFNDPDYVTANAQVQEGLTLQGIQWAFTTGHAGNWHPLTWISHMLDVTILGASPAASHLMNLLFHAANVVLLFLVLQTSTGAIWRSLTVAVLFGLHPMHVESVAWISERKDVLSSCFELLAILIYLRYVYNKRNNVPATKAYSFSLLFFALGLLSKPMVVTLPVILLLLDFWPLRRFGLKSAISDSKQTAATLPPLTRTLATTLIREKMPFLVMSAVVCVITVIVQKRTGLVQSLETVPFGARLVNASISYSRYLGKLFWPDNLAILYPHPGQWPFIQVALSAILLVTLCVGAIWAGRKRPYAITGWYWYFIGLLPVIGLVQVGMQAMADRYSYLPFVGLFMIIVWAAADFRVKRNYPRWMGVAAATLVGGGLAARTIDQVSLWQDSGTLFSHCIDVTSKNYGAHESLGAFMLDRGNLVGARTNYEAALKYHPNHGIALNGMGTVWLRRNEFAQATEYFQAAITAAPWLADSHNNLGVIYKKTGKPEAAMKEYEAALKLAPNSADAHNNIANMLLEQRKNNEAIAHYRRALSIDPSLTPALNNLGSVLADSGKFAEACACYERAVKLKPQDETLWENYGDVLFRMSNFIPSLQHYGRALQLVPNDPEAHFGAGRALARLGRVEEARIQLSEALRLRPNDKDAMAELQALGSPVPKTTGTNSPGTNL